MMRASFYLIFSTLMWGLNFHLLKIMLSSVHFLEAGFWRYFLGTLALGLLGHRSLNSFKWEIPQLKGIAIVGVLGLFSFNLFLFMGMQYTNPINASLIMSLNPLATLLLAYFFSNSVIKYYQLLGGVIGIFGVIFLISKGDVFHLQALQFSKGDTYIFTAMLLSSCYPIWIKKYVSNISSPVFTFATHLICFIAFMIVSPLFSHFQPFNYSIRFWQATLLFGIFGTAITYDKWNKAVLIIGAENAAVYMNLIPLFTTLFAVVLGAEIYTYHYISGGLISTGLLITQLPMLIQRYFFNH